jgi:hypothetical protein
MIWLPLVLGAARSEVTQFCSGECDGTDQGWNLLVLYWWDRGRILLLATALTAVILLLVRDLRRRRWSVAALGAGAWSVFSLAQAVPPAPRVVLIEVMGWLVIGATLARRLLVPKSDSDPPRP